MLVKINLLESKYSGMNDEFYSKTAEFLKKINEFVDRGQLLQAIATLDDGIMYLDNFVNENPVDPKWKLYYYENYRNVLRLYRFTLEAKNDLETFKKEAEVKISRLENRVGKLEK